MSSSFPELGDALALLPWIVAALFALAFLLALIAWRRAATRAGRASRQRNRIARRAENDAERLLEGLGYDILERQLTSVWWLEVDGEEEAVRSRVDLLVERDGQVYVADVNTGAIAPDPRRPATRRQLLEYLYVFEADGALVVDMERREVRTVVFP